MKCAFVGVPLRGLVSARLAWGDIISFNMLSKVLKRLGILRRQGAPMRADLQLPEKSKRVAVDILIIVILIVNIVLVIMIQHVWCIHVFVCMHECVHACMYTCVYVCMYVCMYAYIHICMYT